MTSRDDFVAGYQALVDTAAAVTLDRDVIRAEGPEAGSYLQGQMSQDILAIDQGASAWSLVLQPQGKVDAWVRVTRVDGDTFVIDVDGSWGEALLARLQRFKLRAKIDLELLAWDCVAIRGPAAGVHEARADGLAASAAWPLIGGWDLLGAEVVAPAGLVTAPIEAYEVRRIEAGLPRMGAELTERTIPAEVGVVANSVSFTKGCYTGQELVARIDSRGGHVPRHVVGATIEPGPLPPPGTPIVGGDGAELGLLTSSAVHPAGHTVALASVRRDVPIGAEGTCAGLVTLIVALPLLS
ncbi:MAG: CAF17-like 4Fe-4S cluster assembly/insertion protein YgfZ [Acidimicrobiales bacterium]